MAHHDNVSREGHITKKKDKHSNPRQWKHISRRAWLIMDDNPTRRRRIAPWRKMEDSSLRGGR